MKDPPYRIKNMMPGMIMLWHGTIANIPSGWHLCDGTMGTPNLAWKYVCCTKFEAEIGTTFGSTTHKHTFTGDSHQHDIPAGPEIAAGADFYANTDSEPATGETDLADGRPPSMYLCYIMKL